MPKSPAATLSLLEKTLPVVFPHHPAALFLAAVVNPDAYLAQPSGPDTVVLADPELAALAAYTLPKRRAQWLTGRICAKQATIGYLRRFVPQLVLPDARSIMIDNLPSGRPRVAGPLAAAQQNRSVDLPQRRLRRRPGCSFGLRHRYPGGLADAGAHPRPLLSAA